jgi:hypothetical protein
MTHLSLLATIQAVNRAPEKRLGRSHPKEENFMNTASIKSRSTASRAGWSLLLAVNALLLLNSIGLFFVIAAESMERTISILLAGLSLLGLILARAGLRGSTQLAWRSSWVITSVLFLVAANISLTGQLYVGVFYLFMGGAALLGQLLSSREGAQ